MTEKMDKSLKILAAKAGSNLFLKTISEAFSLLVPIVTTGAIFTLLNNLNLEAYQNFITDMGLKSLLSLPSRFTVDIVSIYLSFAVGYSFLTIKAKTEDGVFAGLTSMLCFFIMAIPDSGAADRQRLTDLFWDCLGCQGMFTALLAGIFAGLIWDRFTENGWGAGAVLPAGAKPFRSLVPGFTAVLVCLAVRGCFVNFTGFSFNQWLYGRLSRPLEALSGSLFAYCALMFLSDVFWFFGIHGAQLTTPFFIILFMSAGIDNQGALASGQPMENILTMGLLSYLTLGGTGTTAGLAVNMLLFSKSRRYKTLGRIAFLPSLCNINEPILFGMPLILNPLMALPFFVIPQLTIILTYIAMSAGLVSMPRIAMQAPGTPLFLDGFLMCGISGVVWQLVLLGITLAGYYPFFRIQDEAAYREEQGDMS